MWREIGMAVPKTTETRCRDKAYKHCANNPIPTSPFHAQCHFPVISEHNRRKMSFTKLWCRDGNVCAVFACPVSTPSFCGFGYCHPYIPPHFWKMFYSLILNMEPQKKPIPQNQNYQLKIINQLSSQLHVVCIIMLRHHPIKKIP